jgi:hypothetical protein
MRGISGFIDDSLVILQSERSQFRARGVVIRVKNASNAQTFRYLDKYLGVVDIDYLIGRNLGDIERKPKDVRVGLAEVDEAGGNKKIHKPVQLELPNPICVQFAPFVADHGDLQPMPDLEPSNQLDHLGVRFRLREHEAPKLSTGERLLFVEDHPTQIFFHRELSLLVGVEGQVMPIFHLSRLQLEVRHRPFAGMMIPPVRE